MVGPSTTEDELRRQWTLLKAAFVLLVGVSAGMIAVQGGADLVSVAAVVVLGLLLGVTLIYYLSSIAPDPQSRSHSNEQRRSVDFGEDEEDRRDDR